MNSYCVSYRRSFSLLLLSLSLSPHCPCHHVHYSITNLLWPQEFQCWPLWGSRLKPSQHDRSTVCMCVYPQYRETPHPPGASTPWLPSWKACPSDEMLRRRTLTVRNVSLAVLEAQRRWGLFRAIWNISGCIVSNWITEYRIRNVPYVLFFATSTPPHPYKLNDMDFSEFNFNEIARVMASLEQSYLHFRSTRLVFFLSHFHSIMCSHSNKFTQ